MVTFNKTSVLTPTGRDIRGDIRGEVRSDAVCHPGCDLERLVFDAYRRAEAMGLVEPDADAQGDLKAARHVASHVRRAGIATAAATALTNVEVPTPAELAALLQTMIAALEASPAPRFEWAGVARVLDDEGLASLLGVSLSSLSGTRRAIASPPIRSRRASISWRWSSATS